MLSLTSYANKKFDILNEHKVFFTAEQIEEALNLPDTVAKKGKYIFYKKDSICVVVKKEDKINRVITFYPVK
ncbi:MAG: hypothetical protein Q8Q23_05010 [bacterium]|nr:hypothetical protein [bacterium]